MSFLRETKVKPSTRRTELIAKDSSVVLDTGSNLRSTYSPELDTLSPKTQKNVTHETDPALITEDLLRSEHFKELEIPERQQKNDLEPANKDSLNEWLQKNILQPDELMSLQEPFKQLNRTDLSTPEHPVQFWLETKHLEPAGEDLHYEWLEKIDEETDELISGQEPKRNDLQTGQHSVQSTLEPEVSKWLHKNDLEPVSKNMLDEQLEKTNLEPDAFISPQEPDRNCLQTAEHFAKLHLEPEHLESSIDDDHHKLMQKNNLEPDELISFHRPTLQLLRNDLRTLEHPIQPYPETELSEWQLENYLELSCDDKPYEGLEKNDLERDELISVQEPRRNFVTPKHCLQDQLELVNVEPAREDKFHEWLLKNNLEPDEIVSVQEPSEQLQENYLQTLVHPENTSQPQLEPKHADWQQQNHLEPADEDLITECLKKVNIEPENLIAAQVPDRSETLEQQSESQMEPDHLQHTSEGKRHVWCGLEPANQDHLVHSYPFYNSITMENLMVPEQIRVPQMLHDGGRKSGHVLQLVSPRRHQGTVLAVEQVPISSSTFSEAPAYLRTYGPGPYQEPHFRNHPQRFQFLKAVCPPPCRAFGGNIRHKSFVLSHFLRPSPPNFTSILPPSSLHLDLQRQVNKNFRLWQMFCRIAKRVHSSSPDVEALSCFLVHSFTSRTADQAFSKMMKKALAEWKKLSNSQRKDYHHMAQTFMEFEEEELKLIMVDEDPKANSYNRKTKEPSDTLQGGDQKTPRTARSPNDERMNVEDLKEKALNEYMEIMTDLQPNIGPQSKEVEEVEEGTFSKYLDELCSQKEFVMKVESIIDLDYLSSLPSSDLIATDLLQEDLVKTQGGPTEAAECHSNHPSTSDSFPNIQPGYFMADGTFYPFPPNFKVSDFLAQVNYTSHASFQTLVSERSTQNDPRAPTRKEASPKYEKRKCKKNVTPKTSSRTNIKNKNRPVIGEQENTEQTEVETAVSQILALLSEPSHSAQGFPTSTGTFEDTNPLLPECESTEKSETGSSEHKVQDGNPTSSVTVSLQMELNNQASTFGNGSLERLCEVQPSSEVPSLDKMFTKSPDCLTDSDQGLPKNLPGTDPTEISPECINNKAAVRDIDTLMKAKSGHSEECCKTGESWMNQQEQIHLDNNPPGEDENKAEEAQKTKASSSEKIRCSAKTQQRLVTKDLRSCSRKTWPKEKCEKTNSETQIMTRSVKAKMTDKKNVEQYMEAPRDGGGDRQHSQEVRTKSEKDLGNVKTKCGNGDELKQHVMKASENLETWRMPSRSRRMVSTSKNHEESEMEPLKEGGGSLTRQTLKKTEVKASRRMTSQGPELRRLTRFNVQRDGEQSNKNLKEFQEPKHNKVEVKKRSTGPQRTTMPHLNESLTDHLNTNILASRKNNNSKGIQTRIVTRRFSQTQDDIPPEGREDKTILSKKIEGETPSYGLSVNEKPGEKSAEINKAESRPETPDRGFGVTVETKNVMKKDNSDLDMNAKINEKRQTRSLAALPQLQVDHKKKGVESEITTKVLMDQHQNRRYMPLKNQAEVRNTIPQMVPQTRSSERRMQEEKTDLRSRKLADSIKVMPKTAKTKKLRNETAEAEDAPVKVIENKEVDPDGSLLTRRKTIEQEMGKQMITTDLPNQHHERRYRTINKPNKVRNQFLLKVPHNTKSDRSKQEETEMRSKRARAPVETQRPALLRVKQDGNDSKNNELQTVKNFVKLRSQTQDEDPPTNMVEKKEDSQDPVMTRRNSQKQEKFITDLFHKHQNRRSTMVKNEDERRNPKLPQTTRSNFKKKEGKMISRHAGDSINDTSPTVKTFTRLKSQTAKGEKESLKVNEKKEEGSKSPMTTRKKRMEN